MRIEAGVVSRGFGRQTRAYAEYRVFSSLARFGHIVAGATVEMSRADRQSVVCVVTVSTADGRRVRIEARGRHPYDAINKAADRVGDVVRQHDAARSRRDNPQVTRSDGRGEMNIYRLIGDRVGTIEARVLAQQLVDWHDAMVKHLRVTESRGGGCVEGCPHDDAQALWAAAMEVFGPDADDLVFLRAHGGGHTPPPITAPALYA